MYLFCFTVYYKQISRAFVVKISIFFLFFFREKQITFRRTSVNFGDRPVIVLAKFPVTTVRKRSRKIPRIQPAILFGRQDFASVKGFLFSFFFRRPPSTQQKENSIQNNTPCTRCPCFLCTRPRHTFWESFASRFVPFLLNRTNNRSSDTRPVLNKTRNITIRSAIYD